MNDRAYLDLATDELLDRALAEQVAATAEDRDEDLRYLVALHERTERGTFDRAMQLASSASRDERELGTRILKELGPWADRTFKAETVPFLGSRLAAEDDPEVLAQVIMALAWQGDPSTREDILRFVADERVAVRFAAIHNLDHYIGASGEPPEAVLAALLGATRDDNRDNRYSSVYDLANFTGCVDIRIREALHERLGDPDDAVREFAAAGLARSDQGWRDLCGSNQPGVAALRHEVRIGNASEWFAFRLGAGHMGWSRVTMVVRGERFTWSDLAEVDTSAWAKWHMEVEAFMSGGPDVEFAIVGTLFTVIKIQLQRHPEGVPQVSGWIGNEGKHWHETLSWCWQVAERSDLDHLAAQLDEAGNVAHAGRLPARSTL
jgi:hypothetical protein